MRFLSDDEMCLCLPAEAKYVLIAERKLAVILERLENKNNRLEREVAAGNLNTAQISIEGKPAAIMWYAVKGETLYVDTLIGLDNVNAMPQYIRAAEKLMNAFGCNTIETMTQRPGMVKELTKAEFTPVGVILRKEYA